MVLMFSGRSSVAESTGVGFNGNSRPDENYSMYSVLRKHTLAELFYKVNEPAKADAIMYKSADYIEDQLNYLSAITKTKKNANPRDIQLGLYLLDEMVKLTSAHGAMDTSKFLKTRLIAMRTKF